MDEALEDYAPMKDKAYDTAPSTNILRCTKQMKRAFQQYVIRIPRDLLK